MPEKTRNPILASRSSWCIGYLLMLTAIVIGLLQFRKWTAATFDNQAAVDRWQEWRSDVDNMPDNAPVKRRVPESELPPAFVLLHDYFAICMLLSIVLCSALYVTFMIMIRGVILSPGKIDYRN
ncbi:MAG: hypothetical protein KDB27_27275 [Planctomycetales bacterium]|nr:hypothetical protein [Planctomycetales bacterium]